VAGSLQRRRAAANGGTRIPTMKKTMVEGNEHLHNNG